MRCVSPWYNRTGWLGLKHQLTYLPVTNVKARCVAVEALHLAHLMASHGYFFPIDDHMLTVKNDNTYYRFQVGEPLVSFLATAYNKHSTAGRSWIEEGRSK